MTEKRSGIVTLTTDFGLRDPYAAAMKGVILSISPKVLLVDVTHHVPPGDIREAADTLARAAPLFPPGTVHVAVVDPGVGGDRRAMAAEANGHVFVGPDNGVLWPAVRNDPDLRMVHLENDAFFRRPVSSTFHGRDVFAPVAAHLAAGTPLNALGNGISDPVRLEAKGPERSTDGLVGEITRVDRFGNLITNIRAGDLDAVARDRVPVIQAGDIRVQGVRSCYEEVPRDDPLAIMGSDGFLELSVNRGRASDRVGLKGEVVVGVKVRIGFEV